MFGLSAVSGQPFPYRKKKEDRTNMTDREAYIAMINKKPIRQITTEESRMFNPSVIPDVKARGFVMEAGNPFPNGGGGKDMFGIEWEFEPAAGGSMVRPGNPLFTDINEWKDKVVWPNLEAWDWKGNSEKNKDFLTKDKFNIMPFMTGWFERLISMMDFENAVLALIDEEQQDALHGFFNKLTDTYIEIFERALNAFPEINGFWIHDDWGGSLNTFFSPEVCEEMIVPYMKRVTDYLHSKGKLCDFHSCGMLSRQVPNMIKAGWDSWMPQSINDTLELYELYGDKIIIGVTYPWPGPEVPEAEQLEAVINFAQKFCVPGKPCLLNTVRQQGYTPFIREKLRELSIEMFS